MSASTSPEGSATVVPFIVTSDALGLIDFLVEVFDGRVEPAAHTVDHDGLLIHAEVAIGDNRVLLCERKPGWPFTPALVQVYVDDAEATAERAMRHGARVVTEATPVFGDTVARFVDPHGNVWWLWQHDPAAWGDGAGEWSENGDESWSSTPELEYFNRTLLDTMVQLDDPLRGPAPREG